MLGTIALYFGLWFIVGYFVAFVYEVSIKLIFGMKDYKDNWCPSGVALLLWPGFVIFGVVMGIYAMCSFGLTKISDATVEKLTKKN